VGSGTNARISDRPHPYVRTARVSTRRCRGSTCRASTTLLRRLRQRVKEAGQRGFYVSVMLFNGWRSRTRDHVGPQPARHPFHRENNVNGVDGDRTATARA